MADEKSNLRLHCVGLSHNTAPIGLRERMALDEDKILASLGRLAHENGRSSIDELVILSTCNRIELYVASRNLAFSELEEFLSDVCDMPGTAFRANLYHYYDLDAANHLFKVAAGLDSLVLGEPQILGQVTQSLELARQQAMAGPVLNRLFQSAIHAGKRARAETAISRNPASVPSLAASLSERTVHRLVDAQIVIVGAGEMAELAVESLRKRGATRILVVNRTLERARVLAQRWKAQAATLENLESALASADILIASTGAPHKVVTTEMVARVMQARPQRPLVLIDIAVPRDIDPEAAGIPGVRLYDIDTLHAQLESSLAERMAEVPQVQDILAEELAGFEEYLKSLEMLPLITDLRRQAESIRQSELEKTLRHLPDLTESERDRIDALTQALVKKLLDSPTNRLRAEAVSPNASEIAEVARNLFGLNHPGGLGDSPSTPAS